ncbi:glutamate racemase [Pectinatus frisingensis]|uniref:glutamate racemase n=1 Tax=Pectinatus frisingensis TaxID=865 RepID=UPI0015F4379E|nr:glutamate racemase [Pectinatus frisingensis]
MQACAPIGVFDSGSGGLTVAYQLHKILPSENIIYVGDLQRMPYGPRNPEEIIKFMQQFLNFFKLKKVKMAVFACNTMTSWGFDAAAGREPYYLVPMNTAVAEAVAVSPHKKIGVIATEATVKKNFHSDVAAELDKDIQVIARACPEFVPLIEGGHIDDMAIETVVRRYMAMFSADKIEALILGCTHYPIIKDLLKKYLPSYVTLVDPALSTAEAARNILEQNKLINDDRQKGSLEFFFSAMPEHAGEMVKIVMGIDNPVISGIDLSKFN